MGLIVLTILICLATLSAAQCPKYRPLSANQSCEMGKKCPFGKSCCPYNGSKFCVSTNPDICIYEGKVIKNRETILLKDKCSTCTCNGYDDFICTDDGCFWPSEKLLSASPNICNFQGKLMNKRESILLKNNCTSCTCNGYDRVVCIDDACSWPREKLLSACIYEGKLREDGLHFLPNNGCNECVCNSGRVQCTMKNCVETYFNRLYANKLFNV